MHSAAHRHHFRVAMPCASGTGLPCCRLPIIRSGARLVAAVVGAVRRGVKVDMTPCDIVVGTLVGILLGGGRVVES